MATNFPSSVDDFATTSPTNLGDDDSTSRTHSERHNDMESAMEAVQSFAYFGTAKRMDAAARTSGDLTVSSSSWSALDTGIDLTVAAASGDYLEVNVSALVGSTSNATNWLQLDAATIVSSSPVHYIGAGGTSAVGVRGWFVTAGNDTGNNDGPMTGAILYQVAADDVSSGTVTLRLYGKTSAANRTLQAGAQTPLRWWVKNLGQ